MTGTVNEPVVCMFAGCRRAATTTVRSGGQVPYYRQATLRLCTGHAQRWNAPVFDQELHKDTDLGRWDEELA